MTPNNPQLNTLLSALRVLLLVIGAVLARDHMDGTSLYHYVMLAAGCVIDVGAAAWALYVASVGFLRTRAAAVQAGINLVSQGAALTANGAVVDRLDGSTPPKLVTLVTSEEIIKNFGPAAAQIAKS